MNPPQPKMLLPLFGRSEADPGERRRMDTNGQWFNHGGGRSQWLAVLLVLLGAGLSFGQSGNQPKQIDYSEFRIVTERNIFNPKRYARSGPRPATQPSSRVDAITLVGTMTYEKGPFAFFEGTSSEYRKVLKPSESIAGYRVTNIAFNSVKLSGQTNEIQLAVGMQLRREDEGPWHISAAPEPLPRPASDLGATPTSRPADSTAAATSVPQAGAGGGSETNAPSAAGAADDVLRRLMQRREQEINR